MRILGIDYGRKKMGLATATTQLAEVYGVIRSETIEDAVKKLKRVIEKENIQKIVLGVSEGKMAVETKEFGRKLRKSVGVPVIFHDETLTTQEAQELALKTKIRRKKRKALEDAYAAFLILQDYLEGHSN